MNILTIAYTGEGSTDERFFANIILRTFEDVLIEANSFIDIYDPVFIRKIGDNSTDKIFDAAQKAADFHVLCVHADADFETDTRAFVERIDPAFQRILASETSVCKNLVAIVPVQMTEAWILADTEVLVEEIGTDKTITELDLPSKINQVERITDPKNTLTNAIKIAFADYPKRRNKLEISDLYQPISQKIRIDKLMQLSSYQKFREAVKKALAILNYIN